MDMKAMWDELYGQKEYAYGVNPNEFLKEALQRYKVRGKILFPADGEGRNGVYAAEQGLLVTSFDLSIEGKKKALNLAEERGVQLRYEVGNLFEQDVLAPEYDAVALIYAHFPPNLRAQYHQKVVDLLAEGGLIIIEGFSTNNLPYREKNPKVGGPANIEMLFTEEMMQTDFRNLEILYLEEVETELKEGLYHVGLGKVIRFIGRKSKG
jgi:cyclopropane fatty-acyl-phospholipid synthase-like methyltransferase